MLTTATSTSLSAIQNGVQRFDRAVTQISDPSGNAGVREIMDLKQAEADIKINAAVLGRINKVSEELIDILV